MSNEPETNPNAPTDRLTQPTQHSNASTTDTSGGDTVPPGATTHESGRESSIYQVLDLQDFLDKHFPAEVDLTNRQVPERTVDTAMRLLLSLSAKTPPSQVKRCTEQYCNQPEGHFPATPHGVVHTI